MSDILSLAEIEARAADGGTAEQFRKGEWGGRSRLVTVVNAKLINTKEEK